MSISFLIHARRYAPEPANSDQNIWPNLLDMQDLLNAARMLLVLAKTSRNVKEQTSNISQRKASDRMKAYAARLGINMRRADHVDRGYSRDGFPLTVGNTMGFDEEFPVQHEIGHAMQTERGDRLGNHTDSSHGEDVAIQLENPIARRAGVRPIGRLSSEQAINLARKKRVTGSSARPDPDRVAQQAQVAGDAKVHLAHFDNGTRFDQNGFRVEPSGVDAKINHRASLAAIRQRAGLSKAETEPTWGFHGGPQEVKQFDPTKKRRGEYGDGFYFTDDHETAERFGPVVSSYKLHLKNPLVVDQMRLHRHLEQATGEKAPRNMAQHGAWITQQARKLGHDGITVNLITGNKYHVTFDPHQIERAELGPAPAIPEGPSIKVKAKTKWEPAF